VGLYVRDEGWFGLQRVRERNPWPVQGPCIRMAGGLRRHRQHGASLRCRLRRLLRQYAHAAADPVPDATDAKALAADATDAEADPGPHAGKTTAARLAASSRMVVCNPHLPPHAAPLCVLICRIQRARTASTAQRRTPAAPGGWTSMFTRRRAQPGTRAWGGNAMQTQATSAAAT
jgi:hypothetical protein